MAATLSLLGVLAGIPGCRGEESPASAPLALRLLGRAPSLDGPSGPPIYQGEVDLPAGRPDSVSVCVQGVDWFAVFDVGGDPDLPPLSSYPGTPVLAHEAEPGCAVVESSGRERVAIRLAAVDTGRVTVTVGQ